MVYDPFFGQRAWATGPPLAAVAAMQAQEAARVAAEQAEALKRAKEAMRSSGATCQTECAGGDGGTGPCAVPAVGRCKACGRAFCETHQSVARPEFAGNTTFSNVASLTECRECQDRAFARATEEAHVARQAAEAARQAAEAARRSEQERIERERQDHAAEVAAWEAETGWTRASERVAWLSIRINKLTPRRRITARGVAGAALVAVVDLVVVVALCAGMAGRNAEQAVLALLVLCTLLWPTGWAMWTVGKLARQRRRRSYIQERDELLRLRGCGDPLCARCEIDYEAPGRPRSTPIPALSIAGVQVECTALVTRFLEAMRAAGFPGASTLPARRPVDRFSGRDRRWIGSHPRTFHPPNPGSRTGSSHLAIRYSLSVHLRGDWQLTAHYTQPPSTESSSQLVISGERGDHSGELRGESWDRRRELCVTIVREILADLAERNGVTI